MKNIPTAEEFLNQKPFIHGMTRLDQQVAMIEFAKLHVQAALKSASEKATYSGFNFASIEIDKDSILDAYPLDQIK